VFAEWWEEKTGQEIPELTVTQMLDQYGYTQGGDRDDDGDQLSLV
jgi:hypothetical protein